MRPASKISHHALAGRAEAQFSVISRTGPIRFLPAEITLRYDHITSEAFLRNLRAALWRPSHAARSQKMKESWLRGQDAHFILGKLSLPPKARGEV